MGTFHVACVVENPVDRRRSARVARVLVDTGSDYTWMTCRDQRAAPRAASGGRDRPARLPTPPCGKPEALADIIRTPRSDGGSTVKRIEAGRLSVASEAAMSAFLALPVPHGDVLRLLGPRPDQAAVAVDPLVKLDEPLTVVQAYVGGLCDASGQVVQPVEILLIADPDTVVPNRQVPTAALLDRLHDLPTLLDRLPAAVGFELLRGVIAPRCTLGPMLYCRKQHCLFLARSPNGARLLRRVPPPQTRPAGEPTRGLPAALLSWDGPVENGSAATTYGGRGGSGPLGEHASLEKLITDQGAVVRHWDGLRPSDPLGAARLEESHRCCGCEEADRCYPTGAGYAYAVDRLVVVNAAETPLIVLPLGAWRLAEAARIVGGLPAREVVRGAGGEDNELAAWRTHEAERIDSTVPPLLLTGESDGRALLEIARLKLGLIAEVLEQLDAVWRATGRPHLCWTSETVRVAWRSPGATPAASWGFRPLLRKLGLQPNTPVETADQTPLAYPPAFSEPALLPPEVVDAARYFDERRPANVFVKSAKPEGDRARAQVLLEDLGVPWELFCIGDALHATGGGSRMVLTPARARDPDDGEGLPFVGSASGEVAGLKPGKSIEGCACCWYPRFGEAVDLHALGMLLLETLLAHDERQAAALRRVLLEERAEVTRSCATLPIEQREGFVRTWITERCEADAPAAIWSRRNLLWRRDDRNATKLEAFPSVLWRATATFALRLITMIPGFSYCESRAAAAPRGQDDLLLPLVELRGLIALLDDQLFGRTAPAADVRRVLG